MKAGQSFKRGKARALHLLIPDVIGMLLSEHPCSSLNVAPDTDRANAQTHTWVQWGGNKAKISTAAPGSLCLVAKDCHQMMVGQQGWNSTCKLKYLQLRAYINLNITFISLGTIGCIGWICTGCNRSLDSPADTDIYVS